MRKKLLIIFPDDCLSHSPTILNLLDIFSESFETQVIAIENGTYENKSIENNQIKFVKTKILINRIIGKIGLHSLYKLIKVLILFNAVKEYKKKYHVDEVIGVDSVGLWIGQRLFGNCHFLSLEIIKDIFWQMVKIDLIKSIVIQTQERFDFLFNDSVARELPTFFIQNSPVFLNEYHSDSNKSFSGKLIYLGSIVPSHGIYSLLEFIDQTQLNNLTLTLKGFFPKEVKQYIKDNYSHLIECQKIILDSSYTSQDKIVDFLTNFSVGFCLYDFNLIEKQDFNYLSCPSGKLFNYYAAGLPVIGSDILGLSSVKEFETGILLNKDDFRHETIEAAIKNISKNYQDLSNNCFKAAKHFDFKLASEPYQKFLNIF